MRFSSRTCSNASAKSRKIPMFWICMSHNDPIRSGSHQTLRNLLKSQQSRYDSTVCLWYQFQFLLDLRIRWSTSPSFQTHKYTFWMIMHLIRHKQSQASCVAVINQFLDNIRCQFRFEVMNSLMPHGQFKIPLPGLSSKAIISIGLET